MSFGPRTNDTGNALLGAAIGGVAGNSIQSAALGGLLGYGAGRVLNKQPLLGSQIGGGARRSRRIQALHKIRGSPSYASPKKRRSPKK